MRDVISEQNHVQKAMELARRLLSHSAVEQHHFAKVEKLVESNTRSWNNSSEETSLYCHFASAIMDSLDATTLETSEDEELYDSLILRGPPADVLLLLVSVLQRTPRSYKQDRIVLILRKFVENGHIEALLKNYSDNSSLSDDTSWCQIETVLISLPERVANSRKTDVPSSLFPENYFSKLCVGLYDILLHACEKLKASIDFNITYLSRLLGRLCTTGHTNSFGNVLLPKLVAQAERDFVCRRVCTKLITSVSNCALESVVTAIMCNLKSCKQVDWFCGDCVCTSSTLQYIFTVKLPLIRTFETDDIMRNIVGHLASSERRRPLFYELLDRILATWGDGTLMKHQGEIQQRYLTRTLMICVGHLRSFITDTVCGERLMSKLLHGVQNHIASPDEKIRLYGMVVAENLSYAIQPEGPKLKFEYDNNDEVSYLLSLMDVSEKQTQTANISMSEVETEPRVDNVNNGASNDPESPDLDSDDDLEPYDMSHDKPLAPRKPTYLRDCMEGLREQEKAEWMEACLQSVGDLIAKCEDELEDLAPELAKILLYLEDRFSTTNFSQLRRQALVTLITRSPKKVAEYLAEQFYERHLTIGQRLDVLDAIALASDELSTPKPSKTTLVPKRSVATVTEAHWEKVVRERIAAKTKRFAKERREQTSPTKNRFSEVAGHFFYPLMRYYDRSQNTFDLLGEDSFVLARLIYTLGIVQSAAAHSPRAPHMARCLVEFVSSLRFHAEAYVREAVLFALSAVALNLPSSFLLSDIYGEICELHGWLVSVVEKDASEVCRARAAQVLQLLASVVNKEAPALAD